jgi:ubiquinone/menaquinone biosynthesis C-methylase UbiE
MAVKKHKHIHHGRSTRDILSGEEILFKAGLKKGDVFLDAGSGDGFISMAASSLVGDRGKIYAVDLYEESIENFKKEIRKKGLNNIEAIVADITNKIPLDDDLVDLCIMANVLHGFVVDGDVDEVMTEIKRVIRPEGTFAVVEFKKEKGTPGPPLDDRITPIQVENILVRYGLKVKKSENVGKYHYIVIAVKE